MRRTIPQKGQSVPSRTSEQDAMATQAKQALPEGNRRVRTSAAMIGLAVSVGAYGLPLPHQGDQATAAEPTSVDPSVSSKTVPFETAAIYSVDEAVQSSKSSESASSPIQHTVQEGQTLWDVARFYGTDASTLASANGLSLNSVLRVGQVLTVPVDSRVALANNGADSSAMPGYYGLVSTTAPSLQEDPRLKANQDQAVETLKQKRDSLRSSLSKANETPSQTVIANAEIAPVTSGNKVSVDPTVISSTRNDGAKEAQVEKPASNNQSVAFQFPNQFSGSNANSLGKTTHQVVPGDTLSTIARANGVSVKQLLEANRISDPNYIFVGQTIVIPGQQASLPQDKFNGAIAAVPSPTMTDVPASVSTSDLNASPSVKAGNDTKIAAVSTFSTTPQPVEVDDSSTRMLRYNHVENLKREIDQLRNKYQAEASRTQVATRTQAKVDVITAAVSTTPASISEPVNPEFNPDRYSARLKEIRSRIRPSEQGQSPAVGATAVQNTQVVATAPLGAESYDPIKARLGKTVSPELPSLGTGSEFLPNVPGQINGYIWPTKGVLTSGYGWRWGRMHKGIDIAGPIGTPVVAAADGRVTYAGWNAGGYGYLVEVTHADGSLTLYAHNNRILVQVGQEVAQGQQISEMGSTGYSTGPHLHFEVHPSGKGAVNPMPFLQARG